MNLTSLLGYRLQNQFVQNFIAGIGAEPETSDWEDRTYFFNFKKSGFSLRFDRQSSLLSLFFGKQMVLTTIHLFFDGRDGFRPFSGDLPSGLAFSDSRRRVQERLGTPSASGKAGVKVPFGWSPSWDRYTMRDHTLHCQYDLNEHRITMITLMTLEATPS